MTRKPNTSRRSSRLDKETRHVELHMQKSTSRGSTSTAVPPPTRRSTRSSRGDNSDQTLVRQHTPPLPPLRRPRHLDKGKGHAKTPVRESSYPYPSVRNSPSPERIPVDFPEWCLPS